MFNNLTYSNKKGIQIIKANSILGLKPLGVEHMADTLLELGLNKFVSQENPLITIKTYNEFYSEDRSFSGMLNEELLLRFSKNLKKKLEPIIVTSDLPVVLGGDCSIILGIMSALKADGDYGLIALDAHSDFYLPTQSMTGEAADMDIALVTGRGPELITNIDGLKPYVNEENIVHIGQRDETETLQYGSCQLSETAIHNYSIERILSKGIENTINSVLTVMRNSGARKFWLHFDTDVIDDAENPAVDYRLPGGLSLQQCESIMRELIQSKLILGMSISIYNPNLDPEKVVGRNLVKLISSLLINN